MSTILFIADGFPPVAGAGIKRPLKFIKFLTRAGWRSLVLTPDNNRFLPLDESLVSEIPKGTTVHRTYTLENLVKRRPATGATMGAAKGVPSGGSRLRRGLYRIYKALGRYLAVPDSNLLWMPSAVPKGIALCRRESVRVIVATGPSFTNFIVGALIHAVTRIPLVLDVRDAWVSDPSIHWRSGLVRRMNAGLERFVVGQAARVVSTNPYVTEDFIRRYPGKPAAAFQTILNGFDIEDFESVRRTPLGRNERFTVVHTGRLYGERTPKHFLHALADLLRERPALRRLVRVIFAGSCEPDLEGNSAADYVRTLGLADVVELIGRVSRGASLELQRQADLLLLLIGIVPEGQALTYGISGKLFDYAVCDRPILTVASAGATREFVLQHGLGPVVSHDDREGMKRELLAATEAFAGGGSPPVPGWDRIAAFDLRQLTGQLATILTELGGGVPAVGPLPPDLEPPRSRPFRAEPSHCGQPD